MVSISLSYCHLVPIDFTVNVPFLNGWTNPGDMQFLKHPGSFSTKQKARNDWDDHNRNFGISLGQNNNHGDCLITENAYIYASNKFSYKQHQWRFNSAYPQLYWLTSPLCVVKPISSTKFLLLKPLKPAFLPWWNPYFSLSPLHLAQLHDGIQRLLPHRDHVRVHVDTSVVPEKFQAQDVGFALPHLLFHVDPKTNLTKRRCIPWNEKMGRFLFHIIQCEAPQWC